MKKNIEIYSACNNWRSDISVLDMYVKILVMTDISGDFTYPIYYLIHFSMLWSVLNNKY
jgi:hypothetical protein